MKLSKQIASWMKKEVKDAGRKGIVFGLSGGIDSAVVGALAKLALGDNVMALILPCQSDPRDVELAFEIAKKFHIETRRIDFEGAFGEIEKTCAESTDLAKANLKPRLRMSVLYYFANSMDYLVAGTGNKTEIAIGYFTKYGDGGADILPIGGLFKEEVRALSRELGIPKEIRERVPSAGLWEGQTDEGEIGMTYSELDKTLKAIENDTPAKVDKKALAKVKKMMKRSQHKRTSIPIFKTFEKNKMIR